MQNREIFFENMCLAARQAGIVANAFQGKVQNEGKEVEDFDPTEDPRKKAQRAAKTMIDEVVQEMLLVAAKEHLDPAKILLDAEEKTPLTKLFGQSKRFPYESSLIIDPIDGTIEYVEGGDTFSICIGVVQKSKVLIALVFFPKWDVAYGIAPDGVSYVYHDFLVQGTGHQKELVIPDRIPKKMYNNSRVPQVMIDRFTDDGYHIINSQTHQSYSDALLEVIGGTARVCVLHSCNIRDILLGAVIGNAKGGFMSDWSGKTLEWPKYGRVPESVFGCEKYQEEITMLVGGKS